MNKPIFELDSFGELYWKLIHETILDSLEFMQKWEKTNNPFYPREMKWTRADICQMLSEYELQKNK